MMMMMMMMIFSTQLEQRLLASTSRWQAVTAKQLAACTSVLQLT
jgi:hypothetical protein